MIIAVKSLFGFIGDIQPGNPMDWTLLLSVTGLAVVGVLMGTKLSHRIPGKILKPAFGIFVLLMGTVIFGIELA